MSFRAFLVGDLVKSSQVSFAALLYEFKKTSKVKAENVKRRNNMKKLSILLAVLLFLGTFVVSNMYVQAAGAGSGLGGSGSSGTDSSGSPVTGFAGFSGTGPIGVRVYFEQGTDVGTDNPQPGTDNGPGSLKDGPS